MIIALFFVVIFTIGIGLMVFDGITNKFSADTACSITCITIVDMFFLIFMGVIMALCHAGTETTIQKNKIEHDSLVAQVQLVNSDYEDVSKVEVIQRVSEWNQKVNSEKYWTYNPWTNWFNDKEVTDALEYIEMDW